MRRALILLLPLVFVLPAQDLPPGVLTLARIRDRVRQAVDQLPDCTCVETVDRFSKSAGKEFKPIDRVILQILFSGGKELFAAPGDTRWEENPFAFLASGMMGNGVFALDLKIVFLNNISVITYKSDEFPALRREARYDFFISHTLSGYTVHNAGASGVVAMRGSFWADPDTYELHRLEYHAEEIPPELRYTDIFTTIYYDRVRIGSSDVLLPQAADVRTTDADGSAKRNLIAFTHCQGFHTESTLRLDAGDAALAAGPAATPPQPAAEGTLPPALLITVAASSSLDDRAPVGALIEGRVAGTVMHKGKVLVPEGALVKGRIRRLERYSDAGDYFIVALEFIEIETPAAQLRFYAELQNVDRPQGVEMVYRTTREERGEIEAPGGAKRLTWSKTSGVRIFTHEVPGVGTFFVRGSHFSLPPGFKTVWKTQLYPRSANP